MMVDVARDRYLTGRLSEMMDCSAARILYTYLLGFHQERLSHGLQTAERRRCEWLLKGAGP